jgi:hypothetical protein
MKGLRIDTPHPKNSTKIFGSVMNEFERFYWLIEATSGPFHITDKPNFRELDAETDRYYISVPKFEGTSAGLWRPGIPRFADLLVVDEFTTLVGILGSENDAMVSATEIGFPFGMTPQFFEVVQKRGHCVLIHIAGWWEAYSANPHLMTRLDQIQGASETDSGLLCRL